jgi:hypothetical protein
MTITDHKINECNDGITIECGAADGADPWAYTIALPNEPKAIMLAFQHGPIGGNGVNGITNEVLLAVVLDRLRRFQKSPFVCRENAIAITKLEEALHWLHHRTRARVVRGVEGTHTP